LRLQETSPAQVCFVGAAQIGWLQTSVCEKGKERCKDWGLITSADPQQWDVKKLLLGRRQYWQIESSHQRLDVSLDEDRSRTRTIKAMTVLGMFRRLTISFAAVWLNPKRKKAKSTTRDFQRSLAAQNARLAFSLITSTNPKAWNAK
jgi:hypothetical protein